MGKVVSSRLHLPTTKKANVSQQVDSKNPHFKTLVNIPETLFLHHLDRHLNLSRKHSLYDRIRVLSKIQTRRIRISS